MAELILSSDGVNSDNFEIALETAVSAYSSNMPVEGAPVGYMTDKPDVIGSVMYASKVELDGATPSKLENDSIEDIYIERRIDNAILEERFAEKKR